METTPEHRAHLDTPAAHVVHAKTHNVGDIVHYTDHARTRHAARIEGLSGSVANLHVFHADGAHADTHVTSVPHSATPAPHTWTHIPE